MHFLKTLFNRSTNTNRRSLSKRSKTLSLESLEQRIALDASGFRPQLEAVREVYIDDSLVGPIPIVFGKSELIGQDTKSFVITSVAAGSTVEKWDAAANQWRDVSTPPTSSNPRQLLQLLQNRIIQKDDQIRWIPRSTGGVTQKAFEIIGWDDGSEITEPEGVNVPGAVQNLEIDIVGDEVQVTWDAPTTGAAVTNYALDQQLDLVTVVPSTQTSHTFAKAASPASYSVTVHANSSEGTGEATTVTVSTGSYVWVDGIVIDPIRDTSGNVLNYDGPNLKPGDESGNMTNLENVVLRNADLTNADLTNADLSNADLTGADLTGANLTGAYLTGATLTGADLEGATLNTGAYNMFGLI
ncbi:MAG: pentapeptide repeat-containing protein, partial [Pirellulales bacterium]|nr:pentapeptide repeat-containing protein [Pirellulales bacterium]